MKIAKNLEQKIEYCTENNLFRKLPIFNNQIDFSSNDYLGFASSEIIFKNTHAYLLENEMFQNGASGSRLTSGNHALYKITENFLAEFHDVETALIFNSGYDANIDFFSAIPQENDLILYDELCHASIKDGIALSAAQSYKFIHNDFEDLEQFILRFSNTNIYIVTESVFSTDGDSPNLEELILISEKYNCYLIVNEAHALGVFGEKGEGLIQHLQLQNRVFARIGTFGKALGSQGAAILGSIQLIEYLINFAKSFTTTTALPPNTVASILMAYQQLEIENSTIQKLRENIIFFNQQKNLLGLKPMFVHSKSAIHSAIVPGSENVMELSHQLQNKGFDVQAILSPFVLEGQERLRFCIHSYNSEEEIRYVLNLVRDFIF